MQSAWYIPPMDDLRQVLDEDPRIDYALVFGSSARGTAHAGSDLDIAVGLSSRERIGALEIGDLIARLERAAGRPVDIVLLDEAPPAVAYRVFRDGRVLVEKNHRALVERKVRAILEYLDFRPIEALAAAGVLSAAARGG
jgi:predicted nucleotidyltransferase